MWVDSALLSAAEQTLYALGVRLCDCLGALQAAGTLGRLAFQQVAAASLLTAQLAGTGHLDTLCGALVGLLLHEY